MSKIFLIALNTSKELLRNRVLYILFFIVLFLIGLLAALGQLSHTEQYRLTMGLGLPVIHLCLAGLTLFIGGTLVYKEIEKLTILTILSRPISRTQFIIGKYFGFLYILILILISLGLLFYLNMLFMGFSVDIHHLFLVFYGYFLELTLLLSVTLFFSSFASSYLAITFSLSFFVVGHWIYSLDQLVKSQSGSIFRTVIQFLEIVFPNLEAFNFRPIAVYQAISATSLFYTTTSCFLWICFFISLAGFVFRSRDFA